MEDRKNKKKTLTISKSFNKKVKPSSLPQQGKKSFSIEKKKPFKSRDINKSNPNSGSTNRFAPNKKCTEPVVSR